MKMVILIVILLIFLIYYEFSARDVNLDANATTIPHRAVIREMNRACYLGNPSAYWAHEAREIVEALKSHLLLITHKSPEDYMCILTSGCSESNNLLFRGFCGKITLSAMEHKTSIDCAHDIGGEIIHGYPHVANFNPTPGSLVSVMAVNNELGDIFDTPAIAKKCHDAGAFFHSDITQLLGKITHERFEYHDALSGSAHKIHGPTGIGFLIVSKRLPINCQISGSQNNAIRGGTYNTSGCAGFLRALQITLKDRERKNEHMKYLCDVLWRRLCELPVPVRKITKKSINTLMVSFLHHDPKYKICNIAVREYLTRCGIKVSIGSACQVNQKGASHVLHELNLPYNVRAGCIRFSFSDYNNVRDIEYLMACLQPYFQRFITI